MYKALSFQSINFLKLDFRMLTKNLFASTLLSALAAAAPRPQVAGYTNADASFSVSDPTGVPATVFGPDSQVPVRTIEQYLDCIC